MADPQFEALMAVLEEQKNLLAGLPGADKTAVENRMNATISSLRGDYERAKTDKEKDAVYHTVAGLADGCTAMASASIDLVRAVQSGDPFAISASTLDLTASLVSTISLAGGPIGAAVGAVLGAILSIVSMILKMFQTESESLLSQIEQLLRKLDAESQLQDLRVARTHINTFTNLAMTINERNAAAAESALLIRERNEKALAANPGAILEIAPIQETRVYSYIKGEFDTNSFTLLFRAANWLFDNEELPRWGEVLSLGIY